MTGFRHSTHRLRRHALLLAAAAAALLVTSVSTASALPADDPVGAGQPAVWSDQADYNPGSTVVLSGSGWQAAERVHLRINDDQGEVWNRDVDVTADDNGTIMDSFTLPDQFVAVYRVTATGEVSGVAITSFTDASLKVSAAPAGTAFTLTYEAFNNSACTSGGNGATTVTGVGASGVSIPTGQNGRNFIKLSAAAIATTPAGAAFVSWASAAGSDNVVASTTSNPICVRLPQGSLNDSYLATYQASNSAPVVTAPTATVNVNEGAAANASGTWSDANAGDSVTLSASVGTITKLGTNASGTWTWSFTATDGPAQTTVVTITANDGHTSTSTTFQLNVANLAPTGTLTNSGPVVEGDSAAVSFATPGDPSTVDAALLRYAFDCAGGSLAAVTYATAGTANAASCGYDDNGSYAASGVILDKDGGRLARTTTVSVTNAAPSVTLTGPAAANEGTTKHYSFTTTDAGAGDTFTLAAADCGSGSIANQVFSAATGAGGFDCTFPDGPAQTAVTARVKDDDGAASNTGSVDVTVANIPPTVTLSPANIYDVGESTAADRTFGFAVSDPGDDAYTTTSDCGPGSLVSATATSFTCRFPDGPASGTVKVTADDGDDSGSAAQHEVTVANVAPHLELSGPTTAEEGDTATYTFHATDPGDDSIAAAAGYPDCDAAGANGVLIAGSYTFDDATGDGSFRCRFPDGPATASVKMKVDDSDGATTSHSEAVRVAAVANVPPTVSLTGPASAQEGDVVAFTYSVSDPGDDTYDVVSEDCGSNGDYVDSPSAGSFRCRFPDGPSGSVVSVQVEDSDGALSNVDSIDVDVANVAPVLTLSGADAADEGDTKTYTYTVSDPGQDTYSIASENCGDNGTYTDTAVADSFRCRFPDGPATSTVNAQVEDSDGALSNVDSIDVDVANVAPVLTLAGAAAADEGDTKTYTYTVSDPGQDTYSVASENCGDNGTYTDTAVADSFRCRFPDGPATSTVSAQVEDSDGAQSNVGTVDVQVANVAPTVTLAGAASANEGDTKTYTYTVSDPGQDTYSIASENCGDNGTYTDTAVADSFRCRFPDGPATSTVNAQVEDSDGALSNVDSIDVDVANVAPVLTLAGAAAADEGDTKTYTYTVSDPGQDTYSVASENCGDNGTYTDTAVADSFRCRFPDGPATSTVSAQVEDSDGAQSNVGTVDVQVANVAPTVTLAGAASANEGDTKTYTYTVSDPGQDTYSIASENCGDNGTYTDTAVADSFRCRFPDGPATSTVNAQVEDSDGALSNVDSIDVDVANVAPVLTLAGAAAADEGDTKTYTYTVSDPGQDTYSVASENCGDNGTYTDTAVADSFRCRFPDGPATSTVSAQVEDSDGAQSNVGTVDVQVANVAPTVTLAGAASANEGDTKTYTYTVSDPGQDTYSIVSESCGDNGTYTDTPATDSFHCSFPDGPATSTVNAQVEDSDGALSNVDSIDVDVANVAPTVTLAGADAADEGDTKTYTYTVSDPGQDTYSVASESCGPNGVYTDTAVADSFQCSFHDGPATTTAGAVVKDSDDAISNAGSVSVTVANVKPAVTAAVGQSTSEGTQASFALGSFGDTGLGDGIWSADVNWGDGSAHASFPLTTQGSIGNRSHTYADNGSYTITVTVTDKDGGAGAAAFTASVANVAPHITGLTATPTFAGPLAFSSSTVTTTFTDPGLLDTWSSLFTWPDATPLSQTVSPFVSGRQVTHTFSTPGCSRAITVKVTDKDGGSDTATTGVQVGTGAFLAPMTNQPVTNKLKNGQVLPVKVQLTDCSGAPVTGLTPAIRLVDGDQTTTSDDTTTAITPNSVSSADTTGVMRYADGFYMYNLRVDVAKLNTDYTVVVYPYGTTNSGQTLRHVIQATK